LEILKPVKIEQALQGTFLVLMWHLPLVRQERLWYSYSEVYATRTSYYYHWWVCRWARFVKSKWHRVDHRFERCQAAIYGTIAANGIILITTKTGKKNSKAKKSHIIRTQVFRKQKS
jgi:hypothetical protein